MIFCTVGNDHHLFDRFSTKIVEFCKLYPEQKFIFQIGYSKINLELPPNLEIIDFLKKEFFLEYLKEAEFILTHAGAGTLLTCLKLNKETYVFPRLKKYNEHLNNHQLDIYEELLNQKYIHPINVFNNSRIKKVSYKYSNEELIIDLKLNIENLIKEYSKK